MDLTPCDAYAGCPKIRELKYYNKKILEKLNKKVICYFLF